MGGGVVIICKGVQLEKSLRCRGGGKGKYSSGVGPLISILCCWIPFPSENGGEDNIKYFFARKSYVSVVPLKYSEIFKD